MKIDDLITESEVQQLDELKAGKYAQVASLLGALAAQHGGKAADAATVGWKQQAPHALATLATYADPKRLGALPATLSSDELNKGEDELTRREKYRKIGRLVSLKDKSIDEGVVARRGNIVELGSLKLHLYPDHVFYIVDGGKEADLSIYKDGAFKPPRNNEIYLKDAGKHGVPDVFAKVIAKFFATQSIDDVVNDLETLYRNHTKKEDLDEGKYNEIFLKGLVGAIMAGGLHMGIDYAKEKTAEYDRQGLQSIYKSIDPREYPQLTKKLTPQDQKGLNAILGKLKEHAMKMEDLTEEEKRMSRAGKGVMKYGKDGMKALAKAGRDGASDEKLDKLRDKYDKYNEGTEPDHEASMAKGQLYNACKNAMELFKMIEDGENLEGWVAAKITKASDYLNSVHDYLVYEKKTMSEGGMPSSVIKHKQAIAALSPEEKKKKFAGKSIRTLKQMSWRHGYGPDSNEYAKYHDGVTTDEVKEDKQKGVDGKACWKGYKRMGTKQKGGKTVDNCVKIKK